MKIAQETTAAVQREAGNAKSRDDNRCGSNGVRTFGRENFRQKLRSVRCSIAGEKWKP